MFLSQLFFFYQLFLRVGSAVEKMVIELWWLLALPFVFFFGWVTSRWDSSQLKTKKTLENKNLETIIFLFAKGKQKKAFNEILNIVKNNQHSFDLQNTLGILYREKGHFDRAIEVHVSLLSRENIQDTTRNSLLLELAEDYICAGIYDRAKTSLDLIENTEKKLEVLEIQLKLAQRLRCWNDALEYLEKIENIKKINLENLRIHFLCELFITGDKTSFEKAKLLAPTHPRVLSIINSDKNENNNLYICLSCSARFSKWFWRCYVCETWDVCEKIC